MPEQDAAADTIMFIGAHHDDNELMAGTMARHREAGWRVVSVVITDGRWGRGTVSDENIEIRNEESREAAKLLGIEPVFLGFREAGFRNTPEAAETLVEQMVAYQPRVIVTHPPLDYHFDHMQTSACVRDASYLCMTSAIGGRPMPRPPRLYYCDAWFLPFEPDVYVDVSAYESLKKEALAVHESQLPEDGRIAGSMIEHEMVRARHRGIEAGCQLAEAYRIDRRLGDVRMAPLLD